METKPSSRSKREWEELEAVAGNGLLDRRAFLRGGAAFAAAMTGYTFVQSAAAEPLADDPWSKVPGNLVPAYGVPSRFEKNVVRTLSNPKGEPRTQHARTPHHLLNGTITPNGLHFVISHAGDPDIDPDKHRLVIHGLVKRPLVFTLDALARYPMVSRMTFVECGGNSAPLFSNEPIQASVQALHGLASCAEWTGVQALHFARGDRHRSEGEVARRRRRGRARLEPQRAAHQGLGRRDDRALPERRAADARATAIRCACSCPAGKAT